MADTQANDHAPAPVGRPRRYQTPEEMELAIERYFLTTAKPTVTGLALELGFLSRQGLHNYEGYSPEFYDAIKRARLRIEMAYEEKLDGSVNAAGPIFALKNLGWRDKIEVETQLPDITVVENSRGPDDVPAK